MRNILVLLGLLINSVVFSQELNCTVNVIAQQTGNDNNVVFKNLEKQLNEFINNTKWTNKSFGQQEQQKAFPGCREEGSRCRWGRAASGKQRRREMTWCRVDS